MPGPEVRKSDALLVCGGDASYLSHWMRQSGLADMLPSLRETVYVGVSGGSMALAPNVFPHLDHENLPENSMANAEKWPPGCRFRGTRSMIRYGSCRS
jgi:dipeptidase E